MSDPVLTASQLADVVKGEGLQRVGSAALITMQPQDMPIAVATALAAQAQAASLPQGYWGLAPGQGVQAEASVLTLTLSEAARKGQNGWDQVPTHRNGSYLLYIPTAVAALAGSVAKPVPADPNVAAQIPGSTPGKDWTALFVPVAEVIVGVVLMAIAANAILKQTTGVDVARGARRAAAVAAV